MTVLSDPLSPRLKPGALFFARDGHGTVMGTGFAGWPSGLTTVTRCVPDAALEFVSVSCVELVATAVERSLHGRDGVYDVTVTVGDDVVAEFVGRSREIGGLVWVGPA